MGVIFYNDTHKLNNERNRALHVSGGYILSGQSGPDFLKYFPFYHRDQNEDAPTTGDGNPIFALKYVNIQKIEDTHSLQLVNHNISMPQPVFSDRIPSTNFVFLATPNMLNYITNTKDVAG